MTDPHNIPPDVANRIANFESPSAKLVQATNDTISDWASKLIQARNIGVFKVNVSDEDTGESASFGVFGFPDPKSIENSDGQRTAFEARLLYVQPSDRLTDDDNVIITRDKLTWRLKVPDPATQIFERELDIDPSLVQDLKASENAESGDSTLRIIEEQIPVNADGTLLYNDLAKRYTIREETLYPSTSQLAMARRALQLVNNHLPTVFQDR